jgi:hypothetical protein
VFLGSSSLGFLLVLIVESLVHGRDLSPFVHALLHET